MDGEIIALHAGTATYFSANSSGTMLWNAIAAGAERDDLVIRLVDEFGIDRGQAETDVDEFVGQLQAHDLLEP